MSSNEEKIKELQKYIKKMKKEIKKLKNKKEDKQKLKRIDDFEAWRLEFVKNFRSKK